MAIHDIYSKRIRSGQDPEDAELIYDDFPEAFRYQVVHLFKGMVGILKREVPVTDIPTGVYLTLIEEYGVPSLSKTGGSPSSQVVAHILDECDVDRVLDAIELFFMRTVAVLPPFILHTSLSLIEELNARFKEHRLGYRYESGRIIRMDSQVMHEELVKPALRLLGDPRFEGPHHEYLTAHERYRSGQYADCILWSNRAFESMLKIICKDRGWIQKDETTASKLIHTVLANGLLPELMRDQLTKLGEVLTLGLPKVRNKMAGHGQGEQVVSPPAYFAEYALHLAAANILLLAKAAFPEGEKDRSPKGNENSRAEFRSGGHYPLD